MKTLNLSPLKKILLLVIFTACCLVACKEEYDHTVDVMNPTVVSLNPIPGVEDIATSSNLVLTFDEPVKKGKGNIVLTGASSEITFDVTSDAVVIEEDPRVVTVKPGELASDETYTVKLERGIFTDLLGNEFLGSTSRPWTFKTAGDIGPLVIGTAPETGASDGSLFKLELTFLAEVMKGEGNISIYTADNAKVADIAVAGSAVVVNNRKVTINLSAPLEFATDYYVLIDNGAFVDTNRKKFKGFAEPTEWRFTTTSGSGSDLVFHLPLDNGFNDESGNKFDGAQGSTATADVQFVNDPVRGKVAHFVAGSYAVLPKHDLLRPTNSQSFSFNMWFKLTAIGSDPVLFSNSNWDSGGNPGLVLCIDGALTYTGPGSEGRGWLVKLAGGGRMDWRAGEMTPQAPALADEQWHMVTVVVNQATKILHVYIDGKEYFRENHATSRDLNTLTGALWDEVNDYPFTIWEDGTGVYNAGSDTRKMLDGYVDDIRYYNKALTAEEVFNLYK